MSNNKKSNNKRRFNTKRSHAKGAKRRKHHSANKLTDQYPTVDNSETEKPRANKLKANENEILKVIPLGGQSGGGDTNMVLLEYGDSAIVIDCGFNLSVELPGINYMISDPTYLMKIKDKLKGYVFTHGHLDHIGAIPHIIPDAPAPLIGTHFTVGMLEKQFTDFAADDHDFHFNPETITLSSDNHERYVLGDFTVELVRVTHSIPDCAMVVIDTPVGRVVNTGDFRLDPEPLDKQPTDRERLEELGEEGVLLLMSESTTTYRPGRTPTEHTLQPSFLDLLMNSPGRVFVASFSSNINRIQMIINGAVKSGRKVAIDGRSMLAHVELAVRLGDIKIPKGAIIPLRESASLPDDEFAVICTGGQGEMNASLQRMSIGEHKYISLKEGDTVVISSTPIPGNEVAYERISDDLVDKGVRLFRAPTYEIDGSGPLHVSGHASRDEFREVVEIFKPKFFMPIYGGPRNRDYHAKLAYEAGMKKNNCFMVHDGEVLQLTENRAQLQGKVASGRVLIDNTGSAVPNIVIKDRLLMQQDGLVTVILTLEKGTGKFLASPDIITRGFIHIRDNEELMRNLRNELQSFAVRRFKNTALKQFKSDLRDHLTHFLYDKTRRSPIVLPVVNIIDTQNNRSNRKRKARADASHD